MAISSAGTSIFLFVIASYSYLNKAGVELSEFAWLPVISLSLVVFLASIGIISLPYIIITELMPNRVSEKTQLKVCERRHLITGDNPSASHREVF